ncbi:hypothetical protein Bca101_020204 [Brassica carinata]
MERPGELRRVDLPGMKRRESDRVERNGLMHPGATPVQTPAKIRVPLRPMTRVPPQQGTYGRKNEAEIEAKKQELAERETAQFGKALGSQPGSEEERRQQALAMLRKKAQDKKDSKRVSVDKNVADGAHKPAKRDGKRVAVGESVTDIAHKQAPPKRAKVPRSTNVGALVLEKTNKEGGHAPAPTTMAKISA